jgi:transcriptional regulator with XRE-family HTH domain
MDEDSLAFREYVLGKAEEQGLSLRQLAIRLDMSPSYLSEVLNGKKNLNVELANRIADFYNVQRVVLYRIAGWVDLSDDEELNNRFSEYAKKDKDLAKLFEKILSIDDPKKRKSMIRLMIAGLEE